MADGALSEVERRLLDTQSAQHVAAGRKPAGSEQQIVTEGARVLCELLLLAGEDGLEMVSGVSELYVSSHNAIQLGGRQTLGAPLVGERLQLRAVGVVVGTRFAIEKNARGDRAGRGRGKEEGRAGDEKE